MAVVEVGQRFGFLVAREKRRIEGGTFWIVVCDCGKEKMVQQAQLHGAPRPIKSCGCKRISLLREARTEHGASIKNDSQEYKTFIAWQSMIWRCNNKARKDWPHYGGRGINVCERWADSFPNFLSDMGVKPKGSSLGRIDNEGNYEPSNCRWESNTEQARNKRTTRWLTYAGKTQAMSAWAEELGLSSYALNARMKCGWSVERALSEPAKNQKNSKCEWRKAA